MNTGERFAISFVSCDKKRNTGGQIKTYTNARKHQAGRVEKQEQPEEQSGSAPARHTNPNHAAHGTINIKTVANQLVKVHTRLILTFNNQEVTL